MTDYDVGYKKPPRHSQFKAGNHANLKGRGKRKIPLEAEIFKSVMNAPAEFQERCKPKRAPRIALAIKHLGRAALKADIGAAALLLDIRAHFEKHGDINPKKIILVLSGVDARL
jgi:hypothetical protein